jgi:hypothetical protein
LRKYWNVVDGPCKTCAINNFVEDEGNKVAEKGLKLYQRQKTEAPPKTKKESRSTSSLVKAETTRKHISCKR